MRDPSIDPRGNSAPALTLPMIARKRGVAGGVARRIRRRPSRARARRCPARARSLAPDTVLDGLRWSNFLLAYQGGDDRALQARYAALVGDARSPPSRRCGARRCRHAMPARGALARRLRLVVLPRRHRGPLLRALDHRARPRRVRGRALPPAAGNRRAVRRVSPRARTSSAAARGGSPSRIAPAIRDDALDVLIYPELGMDATVVRAGRAAPRAAAMLRRGAIR